GQWRRRQETRQTTRHARVDLQGGKGGKGQRGGREEDSPAPRRRIREIQRRGEKGRQGAGRVSQITAQAGHHALVPLLSDARSASGSEKSPVSGAGDHR